MTYCRCSVRELSQPCRDESCETPQLMLQKLKINWYFSDEVLIFFYFLTPSFCLANSLSVIPTGVWGQFIWSEESDQQLAEHPRCVPTELPLLAEWQTPRPRRPGDWNVRLETCPCGIQYWRLENLPPGNRHSSFVNPGFSTRKNKPYLERRMKRFMFMKCSCCISANRIN